MWGVAVGRHPPPPNPPEASRSRQALTGQEQRARQNEPPHRLHGDVGRGRKRNRPQALPSPPQPPAPPPSPLRRPRPSPSALSSAPLEGGGGAAPGPANWSVPRQIGNQWEAWKGGACSYGRQSGLSMCGFLRTERGRRRLAGRKGAWPIASAEGFNRRGPSLCFNELTKR